MTDDERLGRPTVEPMSDAAWSRVERGLWARIDAAAPPGTSGAPTPPSPRRWWLVAAPLAAAAAIAAIVIGTRTPAPEIDEPARVVSGPAPSSVSFGDSHIELAADTAVVMSHDAGQPIVLLERGAAWFTVAPRLQRPEFVVRAGDATVRVVGTRFRVLRTDERIAVDVERGLVDVQFHGAVVGVAASRHWSSETPGQTSTLAAVTPPADPVASSEPPPASEEPAPPPTQPKPAAKPARGRAATPGATSGAAGDTADPAAPHSSELDRDRTEYDRLAALEPKAPEAALAGYMVLARGTSRWAGLALFAAARLAADRHDRRAETLLGIYLQRFPGGANATDARQLLARLKAAHP